MIKRSVNEFDKGLQFRHKLVGCDTNDVTQMMWHTCDFPLFEGPLSIHCVSGIPLFIRILLLCLLYPLWYLTLRFDSFLMADSTYPLFPIISFIGFIIALIPLPWHLQAWNSGTCYYMMWASLACLNQFVNSVVWAGNAVNWAPIWCDICWFFETINNQLLFADLVSCSNSHHSSRICWPSCLLVVYQPTFIPDRQWRGQQIWSCRGESNHISTNYTWPPEKNRRHGQYFSTRLSAFSFH